MLTEVQKKEGWESLFDGTSKRSWHVYNNKSDGAAWKIEDGTLHLDPREKKDGQTVGGGDIVTENEYENFHFQLEWKVGTRGNSGIMFYVKEDPRYERTWHTGPEMQLLDNAAHPDASINKHRAGDLYDLIAGSPETVKGAGEWNHIDIIVNKSALEFKMNGTRILTTTLWDQNWNRLVAGSKFVKWPDFATFKSGRIALQDHGDPVWFRNIMIRNL
ncbi:MAG TPA: DUF1080 domain-containing protein [Flavitalea sp.]|nr:DUF1080 domain-containing protein [Flavitalea sp.]